MGLLKKNTLLVVFAFIIAFLVWQIYKGQIRLNSFKDEIEKLNIENQFFEEEINYDLSKIATQEQVILNQKDAIKFGLLALDNLKKVKSQVSTITKIKIDSVFIELHDTLTLKDTVYLKGFLEVPKRFYYKEKYFDLNGIITLDKLIVDSLKLHNEMKLTIGNKSNGFFKKRTPVVKLTNTNPYMTTLDMNNVVIEKDKKVYDNKLFIFGIGVLGTLILVK